MKGFGIYVKNNLLEPKHIENMDAAVWLYLWLLDKMTSVNENGIGKVLGGMPVSYTQIYAEMGLSERTYRRWLKKLRDTGYIQTLRTPYGLVITVNKAEKIFSKKRAAKCGTSKELRDTPNTAHQSKRDMPNVAKRYAKSASSPATNGTSNKTIQDNTKTIQNTNVLAAERRGKPEINEIFDYWAEQVGYNIESRVKQNRFACSNLLKKHGSDKLKQLIRGVALAQNTQYAPRISDFSQLQQKTHDLVVWGKQKHGEEQEATLAL
jgi:hypothetical protein